MSDVTNHIVLGGSFLAKTFIKPVAYKPLRKPRKTLTETDADDIIRKLQNGQLQVTLAKEYGVASSTINLLKKARGIKIFRKRGVHPKHILEIRDLAAHGIFKRKTLALLYRLSYTNIAGIISYNVWKKVNWKDYWAGEHETNIQVPQNDLNIEVKE